MKTILRGQIVEFVPSIQGHIINRKLVPEQDGALDLTVDTGFSGGIAPFHQKFFNNWICALMDTMYFL